MTGKLRFWWRSLSLLAGLAIALGASVLGPAPGALAARNPNPGVIPPQAHPYGKTYGEWGAAWWQWVFSIPVPPDQPWTHPLFDETGAYCNTGQSGPVWFLGGVINVTGTVERNCTVPPGTALFFPIVNTECSTIEGNGTTEVELRDCARASIDPTTDLQAELDGTPIQISTAYRHQSPLFDLTLPNQNLLQFFGLNVPAGTYRNASVDDGYYLMLAPLPAGQHTLHFRGSFPTFTPDATYHLTVGH